MATISLSLQKSTSGLSFSDTRQSHLYNNNIYTIDSNGKCYKSDVYGNVSLFFNTGGAGWFNLAIDANGNFYVGKNGTGKTVNGYSTKSPSGMVRKNIMKWEKYFA